MKAGIRVAKSGVILGGSEEIMNDLAIKLSSRLMPTLWLSYYKYYIYINNNIKSIFYNYQYYLFFYIKIDF